MSDEILNRPASRGRLHALAIERVISPPELENALAVIGERPDRASWSTWGRRFLAMLGGSLAGAGAIMFFAANWQQMGAWVRLGLAGTLLAAAGAAAIALGLDRTAGKGFALLAALLVGPMFGVYGQAWQTGADPWQLFATWTLATAGIAFAARLAPAWGLALVLGHVTWALYFAQQHGLDLADWKEPKPTIALIALALVDLFVVAGLQSVRREPWIERLAALLFVGLLAVPAIAFVASGDSGGLHFLALTLAAAASLVFHRERLPDLFLLALSRLVVAGLAGFFAGRLFLEELELDLAGVFLTGLAVLAEFAALAKWLQGHWERSRARATGEA